MVANGFIPQPNLFVKESFSKTASKTARSEK
jgi:hypothetical protein